MTGRLPTHPRSVFTGGFTLLEVLVVVAIGAVMVGLVVLRVGQWDTGAEPARQLERLAALIEAQCEQAMFQSRPRGIRITEEGYDFWQSAADGWVMLPGNGIDRPRQWQGGVEPALDVGGHRGHLSEQPEAPQLWCDPLGELSLFTLSLSGGDARADLTGRGLGRMEVEARQ